MKLAALGVGAAVVLAPMSASAQSSYAVVAPPPPGYREPTPRQWGGYWMRFGGIALLVAAGPAELIGTFAYISGDNQDCINHCSLNGSQKLGIGLWASGGALIAIGIPLIIVGNARAKGVDTASALPTVVPTPHGSALRWSL